MKKTNLKTLALVAALAIPFQSAQAGWFDTKSWNDSYKQTVAYLSPYWDSATNFVKERPLTVAMSALAFTALTGLGYYVWNTKDTQLDAMNAFAQKWNKRLDDLKNKAAILNNQCINLKIDTSTLFDSDFFKISNIDFVVNGTTDSSLYARKEFRYTQDKQKHTGNISDLQELYKNAKQQILNAQSHIDQKTINDSIDIIETNNSTQLPKTQPASPRSPNKQARTPLHSPRKQVERVSSYPTTVEKTDEEISFTNPLHQANVTELQEKANQYNALVQEIKKHIKEIKTAKKNSGITNQEIKKLTKDCTPLSKLSFQATLNELNKPLLYANGTLVEDPAIIGKKMNSALEQLKKAKQYLENKQLAQQRERVVNPAPTTNTQTVVVEEQPVVQELSDQKPTVIINSDVSVMAKELFEQFDAVRSTIKSKMAPTTFRGILQSNIASALAGQSLLSNDNINFPQQAQKVRKHLLELPETAGRQELILKMCFIELVAQNYDLCKAVALEDWTPEFMGTMVQPSVLTELVVLGNEFVKCVKALQENSEETLTTDEALSKADLKAKLLDTVKHIQGFNLRAFGDSTWDTFTNPINAILNEISNQANSLKTDSERASFVTHMIDPVMEHWQISGEKIEKVLSQYGFITHKTPEIIKHKEHDVAELETERDAVIKNWTEQVSVMVNQAKTYFSPTDSIDTTRNKQAKIDALEKSLKNSIEKLKATLGTLTPDIKNLWNYHINMQSLAATITARGKNATQQHLNRQFVYDLCTNDECLDPSFQQLHTHYMDLAGNLATPIEKAQAKQAFLTKEQKQQLKLEQDGWSVVNKNEIPKK